MNEESKFFIRLPIHSGQSVRWLNSGRTPRLISEFSFNVGKDVFNLGRVESDPVNEDSEFFIGLAIHSGQFVFIRSFTPGQTGSAIKPEQVCVCGWVKNHEKNIGVLLTAKCMFVVFAEVGIGRSISIVYKICTRLWLHRTVVTLHRTIIVLPLRRPASQDLRVDCSSTCYEVLGAPICFSIIVESGYSWRDCSFV